MTAFNSSGSCVHDAAKGIDHRRDAGIGGAHERQAFLDGAQAGLGEMLVGAGRLRRTRHRWSRSGSDPGAGRRQDLARERSPRSRSSPRPAAGPARQASCASRRARTRRACARTGAGPRPGSSGVEELRAHIRRTAPDAPCRRRRGSCRRRRRPGSRCRTCRRLARQRLVHAGRARDQHGAGRQQSGDLGERAADRDGAGTGRPIPAR